MLKGALFGFGNIGQMLATRINFDKKYGDRARIVAVCDRNREMIEIAGTKFGIKGYLDAKEMLNNDLDFVCVVSTSIAHKEHVLLSAERNLPILCEKPIALNLEDARDMVDAVEKRNLVNIVRYIFRYSSEYRALQRMVMNNKMGDILCVWARNFRGYGLYVGGARHPAIIKPEESGGWTIHHLCHMADVLLWFGGPVARVFCQHQSTVPDVYSEEIIWGNVTFKSSAIGSISDTVACLEDKSVGIIGTRGSAEVITDGIKPLIKYRKEGEADFAPPHIIDPMDLEDDVDEIEHFLNCIEHDESPIVTIRDAYESLKLAMALKKSAVEGRIIHV